MTHVFNEKDISFKLTITNSGILMAYKSETGGNSEVKTFTL